VTSFLERFFHKTIPSDITYEDFLNFRKQSIEEHQYLDYKSGEILVGHEGQCKVTQKVKTQKSRLLRWNLLS
jgi:hypothetical protein